MVSIIVVITCTICAFAAFSYYGAKEDLIEKNRALQEESEKSIAQSVILVDRGMQLFDATFDAKMKEGLGIFLAEYERCQGNPARIDLEFLQRQLDAEYGGSFNLYIINSDGVVEYTTCERDRGLDFKQWPDVYRSITGLREGDAFSADRIVYGFNPTDELRKFAYMPTEDHRYLLELSLTSDAFAIQRNALSYAQIAEELVQLDPNLISVAFYDSIGRRTNASYDEREEGARRNPGADEYVRDVIEEGTAIEVYDEERATCVRYIYIDLSGSDQVSASRMSMVAELTYDMGLQHAEITRLYLTHLMITLLAIAMGVFVAYGSSRYISRPINDLVEDTTIIAAGDLDHPIRPTRGMDFEKLAQSITIMVARLKETIQNLRESEDRIREYTGQLEEMVAERTADLQQSNDEINLYLDILSRDIQRSHTTAASYLGLLKKTLSGSSRQLADRAYTELETGTSVIRHADIVRRMFAEERAMVPVALDEIVDRSIRTHPELQIHATPGGAHVLADELLVEVFSTIFDLISRHAGPGVAVEVSSRSTGEFCEVFIAENGPVITELLQEHPHRRAGTVAAPLSGRTPGFSLVRLLVAHHGGSIRVEAGTPGHPDAGMTVRFTLRTAHPGTDTGERPNND